MIISPSCSPGLLSVSAVFFPSVVLPRSWVVPGFSSVGPPLLFVFSLPPLPSFFSSSFSCLSCLSGPLFALFVVWAVLALLRVVPFLLGFFVWGAIR